MKELIDTIKARTATLAKDNGVTDSKVIQLVESAMTVGASIAVQNRMENEGKETPHSFMVIVFGYWGRGKTIKEAAENCKKQGAKAANKAVVRLILNDDKPSLTSYGYMEREAGSENITIGDGFTLGALLKLDK